MSARLTTTELAHAVVAAAAAATTGDRWPSTRGRIAGALRAMLTWLAVGAPARVFVLDATDGHPVVPELRLHPDLCLVDSPRSATVLLVAGPLPPALHDAARHAHDAMAHPRATVWWRTDDDSAPVAPVASDPWAEQAERIVMRAGADPAPQLAELAAVLVRVQTGLLRGTRASESALLPDVDPAPWRGIGPFGQGGAGMTGGVPYGRPMTGRAADRDGLELDQLPIRVGPFFAPFPPGLILDVKLQGDVIQEVTVPGNAFALQAGDTAERVGPRSVPEAAPAPLISEIERSRARHHLRWLAHALRVHGLAALAQRTLTLSSMLGQGMPHGVRTDVLSLGRLLERSRSLGWATANVGVTPPELVTGRGLGPVARATGVAEDARLDDPAYRALGFEPVVALARAGALGDAHARWRQRFAETVQSLDLAARAGEHRAGAAGAAIEGPRGASPRAPGIAPPSAVLVALLPSLLPGREWGDAVTTVVSLDIDAREAAVGAPPLTPPPAPKISGGMAGMAGMAGMGKAKPATHAAGHDSP